MSLDVFLFRDYNLNILFWPEQLLLGGVTLGPWIAGSACMVSDTVRMSKCGEVDD